jgi:hypothetical protein
MKAHSKGRRTRWLRVAVVAGMLIASHVLNGGSAQAASPRLRPLGEATMASAGNPSGASAIVLAGFTSQNYPLFFKITSDGRMLVTGGVALNMTCTSGAQFVIADAFVKVRIRGNGRLHATFTSPPTAGQNGDTVSGTDTLSAKLGPRHTQLSGVWQLSVHYGFTNGMNDQCDSGPVRFAAAG